MRNSIIYLTILGLIGLLSSCKKEGTQAVLSDSPVAPTISAVPNMTFVRANGTDTVVFTGTAVDAGFSASATYYLEADSAGNQFQNAVVLASGISDASFKFSVSDINGMLIKRLPTDAVSSVEIRIRAVLVATGSGPFVYISPVKSVDVTTYGLPRLDLINSGITQKIESPLGDGNYSGYVKLDPAEAFTLSDPDAGVTYGGSSSVLAVDGAAISVTATGWYQLLVNTTGLAYTLAPFNIGIVGSAVPNVWNAPDVKMDYDIKLGCWYKNYDLEAHDDGGTMKCEFKFRKNDDWGWNVGGTYDNLTQGGSNIVITPGNYLIRLFINSDGQTAHCTVTPV